MKLLPNWQDAWKWFSVQVIAAATAIQLSFLALPDSIRSAIPDKVMHWVAIALLVVAALGRIVDQSKPNAS